MTRQTTQTIGVDYPFESRYLDVNAQRMHYIEQGSGPTVLLLHGNPTWSYMYRNVIPHLAGNSRCIAVDLIGFGLSDKTDIGYSFLEHVDFVTRFIEKLGLKDIAIVGHDWGATIGLQYAANHADNVTAVALIEPQALYPFKDWSAFSPQESRELFQMLRDPLTGWAFMRDHNVFVEGMPSIIVNRTFTLEEHAYYREPFVNPAHRRSTWMFPNQIPIEGQPSEVLQAVELRNEWFTQSMLPKLLVYATPGCTVREPQIEWCKMNLSHLALRDIGNGFHHLTEENPHAIGEAIEQWQNGVRQG